MRLSRRCVPFACVVVLASCGGGGSVPKAPAPAQYNAGTVFTATALPAQYNVVDLGAHAIPMRINDTAQVVGSIQLASGLMAFLFTNGHLHQLGALSGDSGSQAYDINNAGTIVGYSQGADPLGTQHPVKFFATAGPQALTEPSGMDGGYATAVNSSGEIVGVAYASNGPCGSANGGLNVARYDGTPVVLNPGLSPYVSDSGAVTFTTYSSGTPSCNLGQLQANTVVPSNAACAAAAYSQTVDMSGPGAILGNYTVGTAADCHLAAYNGGFITIGGVATQIIGPSSGNVTVSGLNGQNWVVGGNEGTAFVWIAGKSTDLNTLLPASCAWKLTAANDVNAEGDIVGVGTVNGVQHGFLLTP